jgi:hypothetical protein
VCEEYPTGGFGLTLKQMPKTNNKKHPGQHVWKSNWHYVYLNFKNLE